MSTQSSPPARNVIAAESVINAPIETVWRVIADLPRYSAWNNQIPQLDSMVNVGDSFEVASTVFGENPTAATVTLAELDDTAYRLRWTGTIGPAWLLHTDHLHALEAVSETVTSFQTVDRYSGLLAPILLLLIGKRIDALFNASAQSLKTYVESQPAG